ncbi:hypothetical protein WKT02_09960 [Erysipelotrichaceae bacterium HCN-30851]
MNQIKIEGMGTIMEGNYEKIKIDGMGKITGDVEFDSLKIDGACKALGNLTGKEIKINGELKAEKDIRVKQVKINGAVKSAACKIYADEIRVDGLLLNEGEVNADYILIDGSVSLKDVYGDKIYMNPITKKFRFFKHNTGRNRAKTIECSYLEGVDLYCDTVCATEIHLSNNCKIDHITCDGKLVYDHSCKIGTVEGDCEIIVE